MKENVLVERDYHWDNLKAILIFFVVLGHMVGMRLVETLCGNVTIAIYSFHMLLFCFISGLFFEKR